jgi:acetyl esterase
MPVDPQAKLMMDQTAALGLPPIHAVSPALARVFSRARLRPAGPVVEKVEDYLVPGQAGDITARIYTPEGAGPFPLLVWFHGGGWVFGDLDSADSTARNLAVGVGCIVASVDYRLAPDTKFPGPAEDCYAAAQWLIENASAVNADPNKVAVGGDSAGGNLAAAVCLMARDRGGFSFVFQLLVYPVTDFDFTTRSYQENGIDYLLTKESMVWFWNHYLADPIDATNPYAAPLKANDLSGLPEAMVITAEYDPLRDEGEAYAERLRASQVPAKYQCYDGMVHGFFAMSAIIDKAQNALADASFALRRSFGNS